MINPIFAKKISQLSQPWLNKKYYLCHTLPCNMVTISWLKRCWYVLWLFQRDHPILWSACICSGSLSTQVHSPAMPRVPANTLDLKSVVFFLKRTTIYILTLHCAKHSERDARSPGLHYGWHFQLKLIFNSQNEQQIRCIINVKVFDSWFVAK